MNSNVPTLVSIVIPCYKGERYLSEALKSCLGQTYQNLEIIVVDDKSPDNSAAIAQDLAKQDPRIKLVRLNNNRGVSGAFNAGFAVAQGELFTRLAQDDMFREDAIEVMAKYLMTHPQIGMVYCDEQRIDHDGKVIAVVQRPPPAAALTDGNKIGLCVMWREIVWKTIGEFRNEFDTAEDYDYWIRVSSAFKIAHLPNEAPFFMRIHDSMGSRVFSGRQEVVSAKIRARHSYGLSARKILGQGYFNAAFNLREQNQHRAAFRHLLYAVYYWPADLKLYKFTIGLFTQWLRKLVASS
jgi:glycosyltransferase involved in cell wall biosynthesis